MITRFFLLASVAALAWVAATAYSQDPGADGAGGSGKALATFNGGKVTVGDLEAAVARQSPFMRKRYQDPEALKALLDKTLRFELLAQEAEKRGFGDNDSVRQSVKQNAVQELMRKEFDEKLSAESIPEADVQAYYQEHIDEYVRPATRRASHIVVATMDEAKALLKELKDIDLRGFRKTAREKSIEEATKLRGGDLRYFDDQGRLRGEEQAGIPAALAKAAFGLKNTGDLSPKPIAIEGGFSLLMLTGQRPAVERKISDQDVQQSIRVRLWRERRQAAIESFVENLEQQYKPEIKPELLGSIELEEKPVPRGPGIPEGFPKQQPPAPGEEAPSGE